MTMMEERSHEARPTVSVVMPTYNAAPYVGAAISSVLGQTFGDLELIVVDDASTDGTQSIIEGLAAQDARIVFERSQVNQGAAVRRNQALALANGRFVAFLDGDDVWMADKLERQLAFMRSMDSAFSFTGYKVISAEGDELDRIPSMPARLDYPGLMKNTAIGCSTVILDRSKVGEVRFPDMRSRQDFVLWLTILKAGHEAYGLSEMLAAYRIAPGSISRNKRKAALQVWQVYRDRERLSLPRAAWYFANYAVRGLAKYLRARK